MKKYIMVFLVILFLVPLYCFANEQQKLEEKGLKPLSGEEIKILLAGNGIDGVAFRKGKEIPITGKYSEDGTVEFTAGRSKFGGKWYINGGKFCVKHKYDEVCRDTYKTGENEYTDFQDDGSINSRWKVVK